MSTKQPTHTVGLSLLAQFIGGLGINWGKLGREPRPIFLRHDPKGYQANLLTKPTPRWHRGHVCASGDFSGRHSLFL
jgi:hypothetical protein